MTSTASDHPRIAVTLGDPAGVGPEVLVKALADPGLIEGAEVLVLASPAELELAQERAGVELELHATPGPGRIALAADDEPFPAITAGVASAEGGAWSQRQLRRGLALGSAKRIDALAYAPLNKYSMHLAGMAEEDDVRWFARELSASGTFSEINVTPKLWTSRVTSHIPLSQVSANVTFERTVETTMLLHSMRVASGIAQPRLALSALNPHAGENGKFGREEIDILAPAVEHCRSLGIDVIGPLPSDTVFVRALREGLDGVVTMFHDQGQIALKLMSDLNGVTIAGGLPIIIATAAHGTAFDLVGTGTAKPDSMRSTLATAITLAKAKVAAASRE